MVDLLDREMSFVDSWDIQDLVEGFLKHIWKDLFVQDLQIHFMRLLANLKAMSDYKMEGKKGPLRTQSFLLLCMIFIKIPMLFIGVHPENASSPKLIFMHEGRHPSPM